MRWWIILCLLIIGLVAGCSKRHVDPPVYGPYPDGVAARIAALEAARQSGDLVLHVTCCDSMAPLIRDGDYVVVRRVLLSDDMIGHVAAYRPKWHPSGPIVHRIVDRFGDGYLAEGDARRTNTGIAIKPETKEPVTSEIWVGEVVGIYSVAR